MAPRLPQESLTPTKECGGLLILVISWLSPCPVVLFVFVFALSITFGINYKYFPPPSEILSNLCLPVGKLPSCRIVSMLTVIMYVQLPYTSNSFHHQSTTDDWNCMHKAVISRGPHQNYRPSLILFFRSHSFHQKLEAETF